MICLPTSRVRLQLPSHTTAFLLIEWPGRHLRLPFPVCVEEVKIPYRRLVGDGSEGCVITFVSSQEDEPKDDEAENGDATNDAADYGACVVGA